MVAQRKEKKRSAATILGNGLATIFRLIVACAPLYPAIAVNLESAGSQGSTAVCLNIGIVIFAAVCIHNSLSSLKDRQFIGSTLWISLGMLFVFISFTNALSNMAAHSDQSRDQKRFQIQAAATISSRLSQLSRSREEQAKIAGEASADVILADIEKAKSADAKRWQSTGECDPTKTTAGPSRDFCSKIAELKAKHAAAVKRDDLDAKIAKLDEKSDGAPAVPMTVDSYADAMAEGLAAFGYQVKDKETLTTARNWLKALGTELMAGFGPAALLYFMAEIAKEGKRHRSPEPEPREIETVSRSRGPDPKPKKPEPKPEPDISPLPGAIDDPHHSFIARRLERFEGSMMSAGDMFKLWMDDCEKMGISPGTQQAFGRQMKQWFAHEKNNGRPRYLNVRAKTEASGLRLAVSNA